MDLYRSIELDAVLQGSFVNGTTTSDRQLSTGNYARAITASLEGGYPILLAPWLALEPQAQVIWQRLWINNARRHSRDPIIG